MHDPENYEKLKSPKGQNAIVDLLLVPLISKMNMGGKHNQKILDFGCGTGKVAADYLLPFAQATNSKIIGLDISDEMIQHATTHHSQERLHFLCGNLMSDDFKFEKDFDLVVSIFVLHFIKDYKQALKRLFELLKPGGQVGMAIVATHNQFPSYKLIGEDPKWSKYMTGFEEFYPTWMESNNPGEACKEVVAKAAVEVGFEVMDVNLRKMEFTADSFNVYIDFLLTLNPFIHKIPKELHGALKDSVRTHICNHLGLSDTEDTHKNPFPDETYQAVSILLQKPL